MSAIEAERWRLLSPWLDHALDLADAEREAWLAELAREDARLAADLQELLARQAALERERFLDDGAQVPPDLLESPSTLAGQTIGAYTLESLLGRGGMGSVWLARRSDGRYEGKVAVKVLEAALVGSAGEERFRREGSLLARLAHP